MFKILHTFSLMFENEKINHRPIVEKIYIREAEDLLKDFFRILRKK